MKPHGGIASVCRQEQRNQDHMRVSNGNPSLHTANQSKDMCFSTRFQQTGRETKAQSAGSRFSEVVTLKTSALFIGTMLIGKDKRDLQPDSHFMSQLAQL
ncbi:hypothetical protein XENOCAPTIV_000346 [Xenoophorus captivus]|uniref:Uncharacterized protein n=1 Tax=Xenoophorus captivus TaxID=1517983 RepID=A0ABV0RGH8_9TELE